MRQHVEQRITKLTLDYYDAIQSGHAARIDRALNNLQQDITDYYDRLNPSQRKECENYFVNHLHIISKGPNPDPVMLYAISSAHKMDPDQRTEFNNNMSLINKESAFRLPDFPLLFAVPTPISKHRVDWKYHNLFNNSKNSLITQLHSVTEGISSIGEVIANKPDEVKLLNELLHDKRVCMGDVAVKLGAIFGKIAADCNKKDLHMLVSAFGLNTMRPMIGFENNVKKTFHQQLLKYVIRSKTADNAAYFIDRIPNFKQHITPVQMGEIIQTELSNGTSRPAFIMAEKFGEKVGYQKYQLQIEDRLRNDLLLFHAKAGSTHGVQESLQQFRPVNSPNDRTIEKTHFYKLFNTVAEFGDHHMVDAVMPLFRARFADADQFTQIMHAADRNKKRTDLHEHIEAKFAKALDKKRPFGSYWRLSVAAANGDNKSIIRAMNQIERHNEAVSKMVPKQPLDAYENISVEKSFLLFQNAAERSHKETITVMAAKMANGLITYEKNDNVHTTHYMASLLHSIVRMNDKAMLSHTLETFDPILSKSIKYVQQNVTRIAIENANKANTPANVDDMTLHVMLLFPKTTIELINQFVPIKLKHFEQFLSGYLPQLDQEGRTTTIDNLRLHYPDMRQTTVQNVIRNADKITQVLEGCHWFNKNKPFDLKTNITISKIIDAYRNNSLDFMRTSKQPSLLGVEGPVLLRMASLRTGVDENIARSMIHVYFNNAPHQQQIDRSFTKMTTNENSFGKRLREHRKLIEEGPSKRLHTVNIEPAARPR